MRHFWVTWAGRAAATVNAPTKDEARALAAETAPNVLAVRELPYPRAPVINPDGTPAFCFVKTDECLDKTSCPRRRACDD